MLRQTQTVSASRRVGLCPRGFRGRDIGPIPIRLIVMGVPTRLTDMRGLTVDLLPIGIGDILMPWTAEDAERHTKKADSPKRQRMWAEIANSVLTETGDEGRAIREANAAVAKDFIKPTKPI